MPFFQSFRTTHLARFHRFLCTDRETWRQDSGVFGLFGQYSGKSLRAGQITPEQAERYFTALRAYRVALMEAKVRFADAYFDLARSSKNHFAVKEAMDKFENEFKGDRSSEVYLAQREDLTGSGVMQKTDCVRRRRRLVT